MGKTNIQAHRVKAFIKTLEQLEICITQKIKYITDYASVFKFPIILTAKNLRKLKKWQRACRELKDIEL